MTSYYANKNRNFNILQQCHSESLAEGMVCKDCIQCLLLDGWQLGSEVHFPLWLLPSLARWLSEAERRRGSTEASGIRSTSSPSHHILNCGSQKRETRCTLWTKYKLRGGCSGYPFGGCVTTEKFTVKRRRREGRRGEMCCNYTFSQNKTMLINNTAPASVGGAK